MLKLQTAVVHALIFTAIVSSQAQTYSVVATFPANGVADPGAPYGTGVVQAPDGNFYGTTYTGGPSQTGTVFQMTPGGNLTILHIFGGTDGASPQSGLIVGKDGNLYGTTPTTIFKITTAGVFTLLYNGSQVNGRLNGLLQASDGNFYGTSQGTNGAIFKITPTGTFTVLHQFNLSDKNGDVPQGQLIQASDGNLYGTTESAGGNSAGTIFKITTSGTFTLLHNFCAQSNAQASCIDGANPRTGLVQGADGNLYGTANYNNGTIFKISTSGTFSVVYSFCFPNQQVCSDGRTPEGALILGKDGNFYGTTSSGGPKNEGTIFKLTPQGALTTLYNFCSRPSCADGNVPQGTLFQTSNGTLYGTTEEGGTVGNGVVFSLQLPVPPYSCTNTAPVTISSIDSASAYGGYPYLASGSWLEIKGSNLADPNDPRLASGSGQWTSSDFNGANAPINLDGITVSINGKPAYVWYLSPTQLNVQAPEDSATGNVSITVTNCKATSSTAMFSRRTLAPGLLAPSNYSSNGTQYLVATFQSGGAYVLNTALGASFGLNARPAKSGDLIIAYGVGFGDVTPSILPGTVVGQSNQLVNPVTFSFDSIPATLSYQGLAGSFVGLYEFYITVPPGLPNGDIPIHVSQNGTALPQTFSLTIHN
jgi:uncharacterized protein (TIGR03437 family)